LESTKLGLDYLYYELGGTLKCLVGLQAYNVENRYSCGSSFNLVTLLNWVLQLVLITKAGVFKLFKALTLQTFPFKISQTINDI